MAGRWSGDFEDEEGHVVVLVFGLSEGGDGGADVVDEGFGVGGGGGR